MTNTIYFHGTIRDAESVSTSPGDRSQRDIDIVEDYGHLAIVEASTTSHVQGVNPKDSRNEAKDLSSSRRFPSDSETRTPQCEGEKLESSLLKSFSFKELKIATKKFHPNGMLGQGGFGSVFKGWIDNNKLIATKPGRGIAVAVKKLNHGSMQGHKEWLTEVKYLGHLYHPNLVRLFGYCLDDEQRLLVYEFMPRGSLHNHLFGRYSSSLLSWALRIKVLLGVAKGLAFLHSAETNVIHRGVQTSNILIDSNYNAKLSDFGFARDGPTGDMSHVSTRIVGTYGLMDPEYICTGHLTAKSDIYSFGVVLLEVLSGRRAFELFRLSGKQSLVEWVNSYLNHKRKTFHFLDRCLEGQYSLTNVQKASNLAFQCLSVEAKFRPSMDEVVVVLEELQDS